jgi:HK97 family phage prohead protease
MMEKRWFEAALEVRQGETGASTLAGYAAVFGEWSEDLGGFRERIAPGAFEAALTGDVRALWNHDPAFVLGRTTNGTLRLAEDGRGLRVEIDPPEGSLYAGFLENVRRGDVSQMSFGFSVIEDEKSYGEKGERLRLLKEVRLYEVSPVTFPAYPQTAVNVREWPGREGAQNEDLGAELTGSALLGKADAAGDAELTMGAGETVGEAVEVEEEGAGVSDVKLCQQEMAADARRVQAERERRLRLAAA